MKLNRRQAIAALVAIGVSVGRTPQSVVNAARIPMRLAPVASPLTEEEIVDPHQRVYLGRQAMIPAADPYASPIELLGEPNGLAPIVDQIFISNQGDEMSTVRFYDGTAQLLPDFLVLPGHVFTPDPYPICYVRSLSAQVMKGGPVEVSVVALA